MRKINVSGPGGASGLHLKDMPDKKKKYCICPES